MQHVTFLGPYGATFSHDAYTLLAARYGAPVVCPADYVPAQHNADVLPALIEHGGYGAIAMETRAEGRNAEPVESFIELLRAYDRTGQCPLAVIGALRMPIHFHAMARPGMSLGTVDQVLAHTKAIGACRANISALRIPVTQASSNGEAARLVATTDAYARSMAIGPCAAAEQYGLEILHTAFADHPAVTTFFLVGPKSHQVFRGAWNRALIVFEVVHRPNALARALVVLGDAGLNVVHVHSVHTGNSTYHFAVEVDVAGGELRSFADAMDAFSIVTEKHLVFGPFELLSVD